MPAWPHASHRARCKKNLQTLKKQKRKTYLKKKCILHLHDFLQGTEQHVRVEGALVGLVHHDARVAVQILLPDERQTTPTAKDCF